MNDPVLQAVGDLLAGIQTELGEARSMVSRAVIVCETIESDGDRQLHIIHDGNLHTWEIRGMIAEVLADQDAYDVVSLLGEE